MTTAITTPAYGTQYTWSNQALLWNDSLSGLRTWEVSYDTISYALAVGEDVAFAEALSNGPRIAKSESFAFAEARVSDVGLNPAESVTFTEAKVFSYSQAHAESVAFGEGLGNTIGKKVSEAFAFAEANGKLYEMEQSESVSFAENAARSVGYIRQFAETVAFAESVAHTYGLKKSEAFAIADAWRRQGDMVISDMMLSNAGNVTMEDFIDFMKYGNVPGYEKWRDFIPGDYEYREAMFRVVLESKNADRGLLTNLQATIDVPDLIDRGSATIVSAATGVAVTYNRTFHVIPEITLAARGGVGGNPIAPEFYGTPTKASFTVRLRDTVTGAYVTGSFTWAAHGY